MQPQFSPPGRQARAEALGPIAHLPEAVQRLLDPAGFDPIEKPQPQDWLAVQTESGQTCREFLRSHPNFPDERRHTICLQPLEEFTGNGPALSRLQAFAEAFFSLRVRLLPALPRHGLVGVADRVNPESGKKQLFTPDLLKMLRGRLPGYAYCLLGVTMTDLYPDPAWNFVFGQASLNEWECTALPGTTLVFTATKASIQRNGQS